MEFATKSPPIRDHWRAFIGDVAKDFAPSQKDLEFIKEQTVRDNGRYTHLNHCEDFLILTDNSDFYYNRNYTN